MRIRKHRSRYRDKLLLSLRDVYAVVRDHCVVAFGERLYKRVYLRRLRRLDDFLSRCSLASVRDIFIN